MKHKLLFTAIQLVVFSSVYAQNVNGLLFDATNTATRDASAAFEINANTNTPGSPTYGGLLIPRVALTGSTDATTIAGTEATSLLVYNTATVSDVTPGFYYWESGAWKRIIAGNSNFPTGSGTQNYVTKWNNAAGTTIGNSQIFDNATNVGINSATPAGKLDVVGPATGTGVTIRASGGGDVVLASGGTLFFDGNYSYASGNYIRPIGGANTQGFFTAGTERVRITSNGNVGIGTTGPLSSLDVYRATGIGLLDDAIKVHRPASYGQYAFMAYAQSSSDAYFGSVYTGSAGVYGQLYFRQYTQGGVFRDAMFIKTDGNVGIGNTGPSYKLDVTGDTRTTGDFYGDVHVDDTRLVNDPPTTYNNEVAFDFKARATIGVPGSGTYSGNMTIAPWGDNSGDASHQINFNEGGLFWRQGQPDAATWDAWSQIVTTAPGGTGTTDYVTKWTSTTNLGTTTDGGIFGTSGNTGTTRTLTILDNGDARINFGSYPGAYTSALQIQNNDNTDFVWISPLEDANNARIRTGGSGLDYNTPQI